MYDYDSSFYEYKVCAYIRVGSSGAGVKQRRGGENKLFSSFMRR